jgi:hypothetical protein
VVDLEALEEQLCVGVNLLMKGYPDDINLIREIKNFHAYIKGIYLDKGPESLIGHLPRQRFSWISLMQK